MSRKQCCRRFVVPPLQVKSSPKSLRLKRARRERWSVFADLSEVLTRKLAEDGYSGEVRVTQMSTESIIRATRTQNVLGEKGNRELTSLAHKCFKFEEKAVELYAEKVNNSDLCTIAQAESLRYTLSGGLVFEGDSEKLRAQCAKSMKFKDQTHPCVCSNTLGRAAPDRGPKDARLD